MEKGEMFNERGGGEGHEPGGHRPRLIPYISIFGCRAMLSLSPRPEFGVHSRLRREAALHLTRRMARRRSVVK